MTNSDVFQPNWASAPGDTISDLLRERNMSINDFGELISLAAPATKELLEGRATITIALARRLQEVLGASVEFWMSRDYQYREDVSRLNVAEEEWLREVPIGDMIKFGWIDPRPHPSEEVAACLRFFGVPSLAAWRVAYAGVQQMAAFRTSPTFDSQPASVAAWLRQGELEAERIECQDWNPSGFERTLASIRSLTRRRDPKLFVSELQQVCATNGVAIVIVRAPRGCRASGVVRFLTTNKALLQLSFRYLSDDHFWFTFFHEAGHLLLHRERITFIESLRGDNRGIVEGADTLSPTEEEEANVFAARCLIPEEFQDALASLPADSLRVIRFAVHLGVSPGIVVGQLQHLGKLRPDQLNRLKRRYRWDS